MSSICTAESLSTELHRLKYLTCTDALMICNIVGAALGSQSMAIDTVLCVLSTCDSLQFLDQLQFRNVVCLVAYIVCFINNDDLELLAVIRFRVVV